MKKPAGEGEMMKMNDFNVLPAEEQGAFLTVTDMANLLKVSRYSVDKILRQGQLPSVKLGNRYRVKTEDFYKWWDKQAQQAQKNILKGCLPKS